MSITFACDGCAAKIRVGDQFAGKKARCPKCGGRMLVPQLDDDPAEEEEREEELVAVRPSRRRLEERRSARPRQKRKRRSGFTAPFANVFGIDLSVLRLLIVTLLLAGTMSTVVLMVRRHANLILEVKRVDAYAAISGLLHRAHQRPYLIVSREDPAGKFLVVKFKMPGEVFEKHFADQKGLTSLEAATIQLQGDGPPVRGCFMVGTAQEGNQYQVEAARHSSFLGQEGESLYDRLGPGPNCPWTTEGVSQEPDDHTVRFLAHSGMEVQYELPPLPINPDALPNLTAEKKKELKTLMRPTNLPVHITWDDKSAGWLGVEELPEPSSRFLTGWEITCLFPMPASSGDLHLIILDKSVPVKLP